MTRVEAKRSGSLCLSCSFLAMAHFISPVDAQIGQACESAFEKLTAKDVNQGLDTSWASEDKLGSEALLRFIEPHRLNLRFLQMDRFSVSITNQRT